MEDNTMARTVKLVDELNEVFGKHIMSVKDRGFCDHPV
jgi:hypothetical protein